MALQDVNNLLNKLLSILDRFLAQVGQRFDLIDVQVCMTSSIELVIDFEEPSVHVQIVGNQFGQG